MLNLLLQLLYYNIFDCILHLHFSNALVKACDLLNLPLLNDVIQARAYNCFKLLCQKIPKEYLVKTSVIQPVSAVHLAAQNGAHKILKVSTVTVLLLDFRYYH